MERIQDGTPAIRYTGTIRPEYVQEDPVGE